MNESPELTEAEIVRITGYARPGKQLEVLKSIGIPAQRRRDNSVLVMRMHTVHPVALAANEPKLKQYRK